jgi:hypothetical protein
MRQLGDGSRNNSTHLSTGLTAGENVPDVRRLREPDPMCEHVNGVVGDVRPCALRGGWRMSAIPPLLGDKQTSRDRVKNDAHDPLQISGEPSTSLARVQILWCDVSGKDGSLVMAVDGDLRPMSWVTPGLSAAFCVTSAVAFRTFSDPAMVSFPSNLYASVHPAPANLVY